MKPQYTISIDELPFLWDPFSFIASATYQVNDIIGYKLANVPSTLIEMVGSGTPTPKDVVSNLVSSTLKDDGYLEWIYNISRDDLEMCRAKTQELLSKFSMQYPPYFRTLVSIPLRSETKNTIYSAWILTKNNFSLSLEFHGGKLVEQNHPAWCELMEGLISLIIRGEPKSFKTRYYDVILNIPSISILSDGDWKPKQSRGIYCTLLYMVDGSKTGPRIEEEKKEDSEGPKEPKRRLGTTWEDTIYNLKLGGSLTFDGGIKISLDEFIRDERTGNMEAIGSIDLAGNDIPRDTLFIDILPAFVRNIYACGFGDRNNPPGFPPERLRPRFLIEKSKERSVSSSEDKKHRPKKPKEKTKPSPPK